MNKNFSSGRVLWWALITAGALFLLIAVATIGFVLWGHPTTGANGPIAARPTSAANWLRSTFSTEASEGVRQTSEKSWSVKGGRAFMNVRRKDDQTLELRFVYPFDFLSPETVTLVRTRWNLREIEKQADALSITPDQIAALKAISPATDMPVPASDKERLRSIFQGYLLAKDAAGEKALVEAVAELDTRYYDRTIERIDGIAEKMKSILNPEQLTALFERNPNRSNPAPQKR